MTPIGDLRVQLGVKCDEQIPLLGHDDPGPEFTNAHKSCSCGAMWCCSTCRERNHVQHQLLCSGPSPNNMKHESQCHFRDYALERGSQFLLAGMAIAQVLAAVLTDYETHGIDQWSDKELFWWEEYSCPLWWQVGSTCSNERNNRKAQCKRAQTLLKKALQASVLDMYQDCNVHTIAINMMDRVCTLTIFGKIMGMLQCNVMQVEFPSPKEQYVAHLKQLIAESGDDDDDKKEWENTVAKLLDSKLLDSSATTVAPVVGSGLFPILTLANHDCDPNASIEFLGESNQGSLVALRNIPYGEEITITYVPNGDFDCGNDDEGNRFRNFEPTRTWLFFNRVVDNDDSDNESSENVEENEKCKHDGSHPNDNDEENSDDDDDDECNDENGDEDEEEELLAEGSLWTDRAQALAEYGFDCHCARCQDERKKI